MLQLLARQCQKDTDTVKTRSPEVEEMEAVSEETELSNSQSLQAGSGVTQPSLARKVCSHLPEGLSQLTLYFIKPRVLSFYQINMTVIS